VQQQSWEPKSTTQQAKPGHDGVTLEGITCYACQFLGHYADQCLSQSGTNLIQFFIILTQQPALHGISEYLLYNRRRPVRFLFSRFKKISRTNFYQNYNFFNLELNMFYKNSYMLFLVCLLYTTTFLPYGRFYNRLGGNIGMLGSYIFVFCWLTFTFFRKPIVFDLKFTQFTWFTKQCVNMYHPYIDVNKKIVWEVDRYRQFSFSEVLKIIWGYIY